MGLAGTGRCGMSLPEDSRDIRWVEVPARAHGGIWHRLTLKRHWSNDVNGHSSELSEREGGEGKKGGKKCCFQILPASLIHAYKNTQSLSVFNGHKNFVTQF